MSGEFTTVGIIFMVIAWTLVTGLTIFSVARVLMKNKLNDDN